MTENSAPIDDYDPNADLDAVLADLADIDPVAFAEAANFETTEPARSEADEALEAFPAADSKAAAFLAATNTTSQADPFAIDRRITACLKGDELRIDDFKREFAIALATPHGKRTVAHLWAHNHLLNEKLRHPEVANLLLSLPSFIASLDSKDFLVFVENLVESEGFVPTQHWMVVNARASRLLPGHIVTMLVNQGKLENPITANAFITCKSLLKRIVDKEWRMRALRIAFLVCDLPPRWGNFARRIGLADADIAELITLRCKHILRKFREANALPQRDITFLRTLLAPATHDTLGYREVLSDRQLHVVVDAVRRGLGSLPVNSPDGGPTFTDDERLVLTDLRLQTLGRRYRRR